jgi:hypothetical protein
VTLALGFLPLPGDEDEPWKETVDTAIRQDYSRDPLLTDLSRRTYLDTSTFRTLTSRLWGCNGGLPSVRLLSASESPSQSSEKSFAASILNQGKHSEEISRLHVRYFFIHSLSVYLPASSGE